MVIVVCKMVGHSRFSRHTQNLGDHGDWKQIHAIAQQKRALYIQIYTFSESTRQGGDARVRTGLIQHGLVEELSSQSILTVQDHFPSVSRPKLYFSRI